MSERQILPGTEAAGAQRRWIKFLINQGGAALGQFIIFYPDQEYDATTGAAELFYERDGQIFRVHIQEVE